MVRKGIGDRPMMFRRVHFGRSPARTAFSLQEVMVAVGILGIGLILVASVFPVALSQHREAVEGAQTLTLAHRAQTVMETRVNRNLPLPAGAAGLLWQPSANGSLVAGDNNPWFVLPDANIDVVTGNWIPLGGPGGYQCLLNNLFLPLPPLGSPQRCENPLFWGADDETTDARLPVNDLEASERPYRLAWTGFYRELTDGRIQFAAAVCRQKRADAFVAQNLGDLSTAFSSPTVDSSLVCRMPLPWRITAVYSGGRTLSAPTLPVVPPTVFGELMPAGSKVVIMGTVYGPAPQPAIPVGRPLTVSKSAAGEVDVLENISDLPGAPYTLDLWVFPPPYAGGQFGAKSPVLDWVFF